MILLPRAKDPSEGVICSSRRMAANQDSMAKTAKVREVL